MAAPRAKYTPPRVCQLPSCGAVFNRRMREPGVREKPEPTFHYNKRDYCSRECSDTARTKTPTTKTCELVTCGKEFTKRNTHWYAQRYCSVDCRDIAARTDPHVSRRERKAALDKARRQRGRKVSLVKTKKRQRELRQKYKKFVSKSAPKPVHIFPEGERTEVWRPASWK